MGLVTNEELCKVVRGIIIKNFIIPSAFIFFSGDREGSGRINLPALRCRELKFYSVLRHSHPTLLKRNRCEVLCERCRRFFWCRC